MKNRFKLPSFKCLRCGHKWIPRKPEKPTRCPKCKSPYWSKPPTQFVKALPVGVVTSVGQLKVRGRIDLPQHMYEIAKKHRYLAKKVDGKDIRSELQESMISVLFAFSCLEAYINIVGRDNLGSNWTRYESASPEGKWKGVSIALTKKILGKQISVFKKAEKPFNSFLQLNTLRQDLIHFKPEFHDIEDTKYGRTEGTINRINCNTADWACNVVESMVKKFTSALGWPEPDWLT